MRITNSMTSNGTLTNIRRNTSYLHSIVQQIESTKKIKVPSEDPTVASRALMFRTNVAEAQQFLKNIASGTSWMEVTEAAYKDISSNLMTKLEALFTEGATGTETLADKTTLLASVKELVDQIGLDINQTYAGRYVFSGYRTDEPPVFIEDNANLAYTITQNFDSEDVEKIKSFQKLNATDEPVIQDAYVLKLAYNDVSFNEMMNEDGGIKQQLGIKKLDGTYYDIAVKSISDADAYTLPVNDNTVHYIKETGELVLTDNAVNSFEDGTAVTYYKKGYKKGELNPLAYFDCWVSTVVKGFAYPPNTAYISNYPINSKAIYDVLTECKTEVIDTQDFYFSPGNILASFDVGYYLQEYYNAQKTGEDMDGNPIPVDARLTWSSFNDFVKQMYDDETTYNVSAENQSIFTDMLQGAYQLGFDNTALKSPLATASPLVTIDGSGIIVTNFNFTFDSSPEPEFSQISCSPASSTSFGHGFAHMLFDNGDLATPIPVDEIALGDEYAMDDQYIRYECASNNFMRINDLAKDSYTDKMYADLKRLMEFADSLTVSDRKALEEMYAGPPHSLSGADLVNAVDKQISDETAEVNAALHDRFNNMLYLISRHAGGVTQSHTQLGSRMAHLDLLQTRLEEDEVSYTKLLAENEDTEMPEAIMKRASAMQALQAALSANAKIAQLSLADYI